MPTTSKHNPQGGIKGTKEMLLSWQILRRTKTGPKCKKEEFSPERILPLDSGDEWHSRQWNHHCFFWARWDQYWPQHKPVLTAAVFKSFQNLSVHSQYKQIRLWTLNRPIIPVQFSMWALKDRKASRAQANHLIPQTGPKGQAVQSWHWFQQWFQWKHIQTNS